MIEDIMNNLDKRLQKAYDGLARELSKVRTGKAHPGLLDRVKISAYGNETPISHIANIGVPGPTLLVVKPWDKEHINPIDKAIRSSDLGFNPHIKGNAVHIPIPMMTEERRKNAVWTIKQCNEIARRAVRKHRRSALSELDRASKEIGEDAAGRAKKQIEKVIEAAIKKVDEVAEERKSQIMKM